MELSLQGKVALVTGGSRGIGLATARVFSEAGAMVMLSSRKAEALEEAATSLPGEAAWFAAHAGDPAQARACVERTMKLFGSVDVLVNNAATSPYFGPLSQIDLPRADKTVEVNQRAVLVWSQLVLEASMTERGGSILNVASVGGFLVEPGIGWYNVTKAAVIHLTRQMASELGPKVRVNALAPGLVRTELSRRLWEPSGEAVAHRLPMGRIGEPEDVAKCALFLASEASSFITGQILVVDGGASVLPSGGISSAR